MKTNNINVINYIESVLDRYVLEKYLKCVLYKLLVNDALLKNI